MNSSVLIVDDEENLLVLLDRVFQKKGFQVKTTSNGDQALRLIDPVARADRPKLLALKSQNSVLL